MSDPSWFETHLGIALQEYLDLPRDRAASMVRGRVPDLLHFLRAGRGPGEAHAPRRTARLAASLESTLVAAGAAHGIELPNLRDRIVTDDLLRAECDRDQNVYLSALFTRILTRATPDVVFQPKTQQEIDVALGWARDHRLGVTTRGAGSTALGGAVPNDGGLLLDMARFDQIQIDREDAVAVIGAGARLKAVHAALAEHGLALATYPSNLGGTLAGWFSAGGLGLNAFAHGAVQSQVRALSMVLPRGEHVRFHDDGRLDVLAPEPRRLAGEEAAAWLEAHGYPRFGLADLAQMEGQLGVILTLSMRLHPLPHFTPFFFEFATGREAVTFARWVAAGARQHGAVPANLKFLSASHVAAVRRLRGAGDAAARAAVYLDFDDDRAAAAFESRLATREGTGHRDDAEARRWYDDRFRPQQTKRLGPGYLASEILLPGGELHSFLEGATRLASQVGIHLECEAYFLADGRVLALPGWLTRGPRRGFNWELLLAPMLLDLAMSRHAGKPYVLGRWQSPYFKRTFDRDRRRSLQARKRQIDPRRTLNPGVFFSPVFRLPGLQGFYKSWFPIAVRVLRGLYASPLTAWYYRALIGARPAADAAAVSWRQARLQTAGDDAGAVAALLDGAPPEELAAAARGCVNCGECNSVCPVFDDSGIRLPQMLTHMGEALRSKGAVAGTGQLLLDLCMRCGNCQQVCQADIPHLSLYEALDRRTGAFDALRRERHVAGLAYLRQSDRYRYPFLHLRPGGYLQRTPASLPGEVRYLLFRSENDAGADDTCIHCGACVPVCPTSANQEFQETADARRITTDLNRCIGCGTCVEVCPANLVNGGRTLRVMEAPSREFFEELAMFESAAGRDRG